MPRLKKPTMKKPIMVTRVQKALLKRLRAAASSRFGRQKVPERKPQPASRRRSWKREFRVVHPGSLGAPHQDAHNDDASDLGCTTGAASPGMPARLRLPETPRITP